jgi:hypothetical protein
LVENSKDAIIGHRWDWKGKKPCTSFFALQISKKSPFKKQIGGFNFCNANYRLKISRQWLLLPFLHLGRCLWKAASHPLFHLFFLCKNPFAPWRTIVHSCDGNDLQKGLLQNG